MKRNSKIVLAISGFIGVIFLTSVILLSVVVMFNTSFNEDETDGDFQVQRYKYFELDKKLNRTSVGIVNLPKEAVNNFLSYESSSESGVYVLISDFKSHEFECTGSCYCKSNDRRTATMTFTRGVTMLIAALTSIVAYDQAKEMFETECETSSLSGQQCPPNSVITSEVDECHQIVLEEARQFKDVFEDDDAFERHLRDQKNTRDIAREDEIRKEKRKSEIGTNYWQCTGTCFRNRNLKRIEAIEASKVEIDCESLEASSYSHAWNNLEEVSSVLDFTLPYDELWDLEVEEVKKNFHLYYLTPFCRERSQTKVRVFQKDDNEKIPKKGKVYTYWLCNANEKGRKDGPDLKWVTNPTIDCVRTDVPLDGRHGHDFYEADRYEDNQQSEKDEKIPDGFPRF